MSGGGRAHPRASAAGVLAAATLQDALTVFVEWALAEAEVPRGVLLRSQATGRLHGEVGAGWESAEIRALDVAPAEHPPLAAALASGEPAELRTTTLLPGLGACTAVPLAAAGEAPLGVLLLDPPPERDGVARVQRAYAEVARPIARLAELDALRTGRRQLEQQQALLASLLDALPDPVLVTDAQNNVVLENRRAEALLTTVEGDSEGKRRAVEINNLLLSSFLTRSLIGGSDPASRELNLVDPTEGGDLLFEVLTSPVPAGIGDEGSVLSVLRDVTDLKRASTELEQQFKRVRQGEAKSRRERDRLNLILENVGDPILVTDEEANITLMNRQAEHLFDVPADVEAQSGHRREVRANDTRFSSHISDFALGPETSRTEELDLHDPGTHKAFPVEIVSGKILNDRGELTAIVSIVHDLTKVVENERLAAELTTLNEGLEDRIREATEELEERNRRLEWQSQELERAYRLKSEFLASMSHELRTPINALLGYTALMRDRIYGEVSGRQDEALERMYAASQHLLELVNDVLDLAKIEAGKMPVHPEPVDLRQLVQELSETVEPMVRKKNLRYRIDVAPDVSTIETDRTKVKQIVLNLLSNAVKFTHEGEVSVAVRLAEGGGGVLIEVSDSGIGIRDDDLAHIFDDFRQVDQSSTREYGGTGLGLSITKKLLNLLEGWVEVRSCLGGGSTFTVWIPLDSTPASPGGPPTRDGGDNVHVAGESCA